MKRAWSFLSLAAAILVVAAALPAAAQETHVELAIGASYPLTSQNFRVEQAPSYRFRFDWRITPKWAVGVTYSYLKTKDDLSITPGPDAPPVQTPSYFQTAKMSLYGLQGSYVIVGEPTFQVLVLAGLGAGKLQYDDTAVRKAGDANWLRLAPDTNISYYWEVGAGVQFSPVRWFNVRFAFNFQQIHPKDRSMLLENSQTMIVPSLDVGFRF